jgi:hypothetical protein
MVSALTTVDDLDDPAGSMLRAAFEIAARLTGEDYEPVPIGVLTCGTLDEDALPQVLDVVRADAEELRLAMLGE